MGQERNGTPLQANRTIADDPCSLLLILSGWCWSGWMPLLWPHDQPHGYTHADDHGQLVVPEPIEEQGEHGLFA